MDLKQRPPLYYDTLTKSRFIDQPDNLKQIGDQNVSIKQNSTYIQPKQMPYELDYVQKQKDTLVRHLLESQHHPMQAQYNSYFTSIHDSNDLYTTRTTPLKDIQDPYYNERVISRETTSAGISR